MKVEESPVSIGYRKEELYENKIFTSFRKVIEEETQGLVS